MKGWVSGVDGCSWPVRKRGSRSNRALGCRSTCDTQEVRVVRVGMSEYKTKFEWRRHRCWRLRPLEGVTINTKERSIKLPTLYTVCGIEVVDLGRRVVDLDAEYVDPGIWSGGLRRQFVDLWCG